ncbi:hypothetical protein [Paenibacillus aquistagni]|uniref:PH domain-containing protein n=1 Tax=Paenibacillus aquistagni TaxID=1852522 RepID=A0A1X7JBM1_9BACL|nr:hypothetical protein [Paenibacillus aquistagni]SMG25041.1 hypothetical protein SAMN06295960_1413 [Paenibacillus aquistagni]
MSRSWERQVRKNSEKMYKHRQKNGAGQTNKPGEPDEFKGRNLILPSVLIILTVVYGFMFQFSQEQSTTLYWITIVLYLLLALMIFFKRPYLKVAKDHLITTKWNRVKVLYAKDIKKIHLTKGSVQIEPAKKGSNWVFVRLTNRFDTDAMADRLIQFAQQQKVEYEQTN